MTLVRALAIVTFLGVSAPGALLAAPPSAPATPSAPGPTPTPKPAVPYTEQIAGALRDVQPLLNACANKPSPPVHGSVTFSIAVASGGQILSSNVLGTTLTDASVTTCIAVQVHNHLKLPPPPSNNYTFKHTFVVPGVVAAVEQPSAMVATDKWRTVLDQVDISICKKAGTQRGPGKVKLDIQSSGEVASANLVSPSLYDNTVVGMCILARYRHASFDPGEAKEYVYTFDLK